jgi:hypothetical protein
MTTNPLEALLDSVAQLRAAWDDAGDERAMTDAELLAANERLAAARRLLDGVHTGVAAEVARRSRAELGKEGLARQAGYRSPAKLIAATTGGHTGDAARLIQVGEATRARTLLSGQAAPAAHPHVCTAVQDGTLSVAAASAITTMLDRLAVRVDAGIRDTAEATLVAQAPLLSLDELQLVLRRAEAHLDPDGLAPATAAARGERSLKITHDPSGMTVLTARLDVETAAPVVAAIEGIVTHQLRTSRGRNTPDGTRVDSPADESRTLSQLRADALAAVCAHVIGCDQDRLPGSATTVIVRMDLQQLRTGTGVSTIDGLEQPVDAGTARRMAAAAGVIPAVLGAASEILDFGRTRRHFSPAQRRALVERDGGCASCHLPPAFTEAHHLRWWDRDVGPTDLDNGILLCTGCHHRIHEEGWEILIERPAGVPPAAGEVWFVPPAHIDPARTPRRGGRRRFDPLAWHLAA